MKFYILGVILLLLQSSVFIKIFSYNGIIPDFLTIFVIIYALKNNLKDSLKLAVFLGILQDLLSPIGLVFNTITKSLIVIVTLTFKDKFYYSSLLIKGFLILLVTAVDVGIKSALIFFKTGVFELSYQHLIYFLLNLSVFYAVSFLDENR
ncbi:hypothetical protein [Persephonella sp.]|uniref:hypothetical protein n=1 Tax=Persephonella sp. TaxID=2060922 RepID=UPI0026170A8F|nr:hypothetical protein [Persephonella sp.]